MSELFVYYPIWLWFVITTVLGMITGSFLTVVTHRLPKIIQQHWEDETLSSHQKPSKETISLVSPSSHCPNCETPILWRHKIPLFSFIVLRGRCAYCNSPIGLHYFNIELLTLLVWLAIFYIHGISYMTLASVMLASCLIALAFIDQKEGLLPDQITLPLLWIGLVLNSFGLIVTPQQAIIGATSGYLFFYLLNKLFKLVRKRDGLGQGDMKLIAVLGAWLGWQILPGLVLIASSAGLLVSLMLRYRQQTTLSDAIPFGPYLSLAGILSLLFYQQLTNIIFFIVV